MTKIYEEVLCEIKPTDEEFKEINDFSSKLMKIILDKASDMGLDVECRLVGSVAKKTCLIGKADVDIFMAFDLDYSEDELKSYGLELGSYCISAVGGESEKRYASHPYMTGLIDGYEVDFVPCYKIGDASQLKSAVDRTIIHTDYIQSHLEEGQEDEVLLLKKFMTSINTYGANYKVSGFSGYLCELLVLAYGNFQEVIESAAYKWGRRLELDLEDYGTSSNFDDPLVFIDPTDANRNVAAALSTQKYNEFIVASRNFLKNPTREYFSDRPIDVDREYLHDGFNRRGTYCCVLSFSVPPLPSDVIYPQVNKSCKSFTRVSQKYDFSVVRSSYYIRSDNKACILLEYENGALSNIDIGYGPIVRDRVNGDNFKRKNPDAYIVGEKWVVMKKRPYSHVEDMINALINEYDMPELKLGKNVKKELKKGYKLCDIHEHIECGCGDDFEELYLYLNPYHRLVR